MKTWNRERKRTRDRLLQYDTTIVPTPYSTSIPMIYPWQNASLAILSHQIFKLAQTSGYTGTEDLLFRRFNGGAIHPYKTLEEFPIPGIQGDLYLETSTQIVYYYTTTTGEIDAENIAAVGGVIVDYSVANNETAIYLPIRALTIEPLLLNCGDAAEYID